MRVFAARGGNGWIPSHLSPKDYENMMKEVLDEAEKHGRCRDDLTFVHSTRILTGPYMNEVLRSMPQDHILRIRKRYIVGPPKSCVEELQKYLDIGVDLMLLLRLHHIAQTSFVNERKHRQQIAFVHNEIFSQLEE